MQNKPELLEKISATVLSLGATKVGVVEVKDIPLDRVFRDMCAANSCGAYGKNWTCPPASGDIDDLMEKIRSYDTAVVYQTIGEIEDSFDFEGMTEVGERHRQLVFDVRDACREMELGEALFLGAGGCRYCPVCAKVTDEPCRFPDQAISSLEAHGINVSKLAPLAGMKYINGANTVTYFGGIFLRD